MLKQGGAVLIIVKPLVQPYFRCLDPLFLSRNCIITHAATRCNVWGKKNEMHCFEISVYNMIILKLFKAGISSIRIVGLVWENNVIIYGVWKGRDEMNVVAFKVL